MRTTSLEKRISLLELKPKSPKNLLSESRKKLISLEHEIDNLQADYDALDEMEYWNFDNQIVLKYEKLRMATSIIKKAFRYLKEPETWNWFERNYTEKKLKEIEETRKQRNHLRVVTIIDYIKKGMWGDPIQITKGRAAQTAFLIIKLKISYEKADAMYEEREDKRNKLASIVDREYELTEFLKYCFNEIDKYLEKNNTNALQ